MKNVLLFVITFVIGCWAVPKPMESVANYSMLMVHGAYGSDKGVENCSSETLEAVKENKYLTTSKEGANIGYYHDKSRLTSWLESLIFEDTTSYDSLNPFSDIRRSQGVPYIYSWRAFTNPANSSINNAHELGDRKWKGCGQRRALVEESQEVKALFVREKDTLYGQVALDSIRKYPDLYRQIPSRYILIGHSMGGIASREWIQNSDYYYGDVDKVITLDSPHEGTGALNAQLRMWDHFTIAQNIVSGAIWNAAVLFGLSMVPWEMGFMKYAAYTYAVLAFITANMSPGVEAFLEYVRKDLQHYRDEDPLVAYLDPSREGKANHVSALKSVSPHDSLPMFRLLGGRESMTFTDLEDDYPASVAIGWVFPNNYVSAIGNFFTHFDLETIAFNNAYCGFLMGMVGNINVWDKGTSLVSVSSGMADSTESLISPMVDVKRSNFFAAEYTKRQDDWVTPFLATMKMTVIACELFGIAAEIWGGPAVKTAGEIAIAASGLLTLTATGVYAFKDGIGGFKDLGKSHQLPLKKRVSGNMVL
jgi:pimeloyl-ACP methyl ester carboxylesterase